MTSSGLEYVLPVLLLLFSACSSPAKDQSAVAEAEIRQAELDFARLAGEKGIATAFGEYADSLAVIKRGRDSLIHGKEGILHYYGIQSLEGIKLDWAPDFVKASADGNWGYTYGHYTWESADSAGQMQRTTGIFHTVWKKQADGSWRYVWD